MSQNDAEMAIEAFVSSVYLPRSHAAADGWEAAAASPAHRTLLLKLEGQPVLQLPLRCTALCLAPLAAGGGSATGSSAGVNGHSSCSGPSPVRFEAMHMVQAAGRWGLPGLLSAVANRHSPLPLHLVCVEDCGGLPATSSCAPTRQAAGVASPPTVLGVGSLLLSWPAAGGMISSSGCSGGMDQPCRSPPGPCAPQRGPIQREPLRCCRLVSPSTGAEVGSISLAVRLVELPPSGAAPPQPQQPAPSQAAAAMPPALQQPALGSEPSRRSSRQQPPRRTMRSAGVQAGLAAAGTQPSGQPAQQQAAVGAMQLLCMPQAAYVAGTAMQCPCWAIQAAPMLAPMPVPVLGVPVQPPVQPHLPTALLPASAPPGGIPAAAHQLPIAQPVVRFGAAVTPVHAAAEAASPLGPLPPRVAAVRTRVAQQQRQQQQCGMHAVPSPPDVAEGSELLCTLRSPLRAAEHAPPLQHHLREVSSPRRCTSPVKRHEAMAASTLGRPPSSRGGGRPSSAGRSGSAVPQLCCPGCLEPFLRLPCSPIKRPQSSRAVAAGQRVPVERSGGCCLHCGGQQQQLGLAQQAQQRVQQLEMKPSSIGRPGGSGPGKHITQQSSASAAGDPNFERLLLQLNLSNSEWRGLLMRSLQGALETQGSHGDGEPADEPARGCTAGTDGADGAAGPGEQASKQEAAAGVLLESEPPGGQLKGKRGQAGSLPASPRVPARRRSSAAVVGVEGAAVAAHGSSIVAAVPAAGWRGAAAAKVQAVPAATDTMRQVISSNRQLIRQQLASAAASGTARGMRRQPEQVRSADGEAEPVGQPDMHSAAAAEFGVPAAESSSQQGALAAATVGGQRIESADDIVARLQCHQHSFSSSSCGGGAEGLGRTGSEGELDTADDAQLPAGRCGAALGEPQPSQSTLVSFGSEWEQPLGTSYGEHGGGAEQASGGYSSSEYEDDFEPE